MRTSKLSRVSGLLRVDGTRVSGIRVSGLHRVGGTRVSGLLRVDGTRVGSIRVIGLLRVDGTRVGDLRVNSLRVGSRKRGTICNKLIFCKNFLLVFRIQIQGLSGSVSGFAES